MDLRERTSTWVERGIITLGQKDAILETEEDPSRKPVRSLDGLIPLQGWRAEAFVVFFGLLGLFLADPSRMITEEFFLFAFLATVAGSGLLIVFPRHLVIGDSVVLMAVAFLGLSIWLAEADAIASGVVAVWAALFSVLRITRLSVSVLAGVVSWTAIGNTFFSEDSAVLLLGVVAVPVVSLITLRYGPVLARWWRARAAESRARRRSRR